MYDSHVYYTDSVLPQIHAVRQELSDFKVMVMSDLGFIKESLEKLEKIITAVESTCKVTWSML